MQVLFCVEQILRQHKLATPLGNEAELDLTRTKNKDKIIINSSAMNSDLKNGCDIDSDNIIPVELEDLSEELRLEMELALEEQRGMARGTPEDAERRGQEGGHTKCCAECI